MTGAEAWSDAVWAVRLFAIDPAGVGGVLVRSRAGPVRNRWLAMMNDSLLPSATVRRAPLHIADGRLLGGLDLAATLRTGRPVAERGLLAEANGGVLIVAMAERLSSSTAAHLTATMDAGAVAIERDGLSLSCPARFGVVALDEGLEDEFVTASLRDRLAMHIDLNDLPFSETEVFSLDPATTQAARQRLVELKASSAQIEAICKAAAALGIESLRAPLLTSRVACMSAAFAGSSSVTDDDIALAARLVLAPRALIVPQSQEPDQTAPPPRDQPPENADAGDESQQPDPDRALDDVILAAVQAAMPPGVLLALQAASRERSRGRSAGKAGAVQQSQRRGRPAGVRRGELRSGARLNVIETLRAAAPWQPLRRKELAQGKEIAHSRVLIRHEDFRLQRFKQRTQTTTIFVVDASGSAALHRLAEAKGAVELLLADCYVRRDQVALIAFRGVGAELLLPPTRSLARAKRSLAGLPGGGGTPLAAGLDAANTLADSLRRKGQTPIVIVLTDGRANIARDGSAGRPRAEEDATVSAQQLRAAGVAGVLVDTSPRPQPQAAQLAAEMGARYLPLPHADAATLSRAILATTGTGVEKRPVRS
jgi:magnesium chelatase subunit D